MTREHSSRSRCLHWVCWCIIAAVAGTAGCDSSSWDPGSFGYNIAPETSLNAGPVQPEPGGGHRVRLNWFGWDPDGSVVRFEARIAVNDTLGEKFSVVTTDSVFIIGPEVTQSWDFYVAAVDNEGGEDPTPASFTHEMQK